MTVEFGFYLPNFGETRDPLKTKHLAQQVERWGFGSVWVREHVVHPSDTALHEPFVTLSALSSVTDEVTLGTSTLIPVRHPVMLAKSLTTLTEYANGRVVAGLGVGGLKDDFDAVGLPFESRASLFEETVEILRGLSEEESFTYEGEFFSIEDVTLSPQPPDPFPRIWVGGNSRNALDRAGRFGDVWTPYALSAEKMRRGLDVIEDEQGPVGVAPVLPLVVSESGEIPSHAAAAIEDAGRIGDDPDRQTLMGSPEDCIARIQDYIDAGADHVVFDPRYDLDNVTQQAELAATKILSSF